MRNSKIGIFIGRRESVLTGYLPGRNSTVPALIFFEPRSPGQTPKEALAGLLKKIPTDWSGSEIKIALSSFDLACSELVKVPLPRPTEKNVAAMSGSLAESFCTGESLDDLIVDFFPTDQRRSDFSHIGLLAIKKTLILELQECVKSSPLGLHVSVITSGVSALASALIQKEISGITALCTRESEECIIIDLEQKGIASWRTFPLSKTAADFEARVTKAVESLNSSGKATIRFWHQEQEQLNFNGFTSTARSALAAAVAHATPANTGNLLRGTEGETQRKAKRLRLPLRTAAVAAAALCLSCGWSFSLQTQKNQESLTRVSQEITALQKTVLPGQRLSPSRFVATLKQRAKEAAQNADPNKYFSALTFWSEIAAALPAADQLGMVLESMDLTPEGGRITWKVALTPGDPMRNAITLEHSLNNSPRLSARGDMEAQEKEAVVRMRLDYRPPVLALTEQKL